MFFWTRLYVDTESISIDKVKGVIHDVADFRKIVHKNWRRTLQHTDSSLLLVYSNEDERKANRNLAGSVPLGGYFTTEENPLVVVAPARPAGL